MKAFLVLALTLAAAATALAFGHADVAAVREAVAASTRSTEPATLLLSGSALLALGGVLRRFLV